MDDLQTAYTTFFGKSDDLHRIFSPYRICPLGAHVDHQHGLVTGFAFDSGIKFLFSVTGNGSIEMASLSFEGLTAFDVRDNVGKPQGNWGDYIRGAVWALQQEYRLEKGIKGIVKGSMPIGGLSSSAALLCGVVMAVAKANALELPRHDIIRFASMAERQYVGLNNGILDQACVVLCRKDKLLYLDTRSGEHKLIPFGGVVGGDRLPFKLGVFFSGVTRKLTGTDYNLRVSECKTAAWMVQAYEGEQLKDLQETRLRDIAPESFARHEARMPERFARRARHFFSECDRVTRGVEAWENGDLETFGQLIFDSCASSVGNYECGSPELTSLYLIMKETAGIYGGRFSGAGFKGACIALVDPGKTEEVKAEVTRRYLEIYPQYRDEFQIYFCDPADGVDFV